MISSVNRLIFDASSPNRYATFFYAQYLPFMRLLTYVNAGHNAPVLLRGKDLIRLDTGGPVVGRLPSATYEQRLIELQYGDLIVLFTDGSSESMNVADEEWGEDRQEPAAKIRNMLIASTDGFASAAPQDDDMTVVVLKVTDPRRDAGRLEQPSETSPNSARRRTPAAPARP